MRAYWAWGRISADRGGGIVGTGRDALRARIREKVFVFLLSLCHQRTGKPLYTGDSGGDGCGFTVTLPSPYCHPGKRSGVASREAGCAVLGFFPWRGVTAMRLSEINGMFSHKKRQGYGGKTAGL